MIATHYHSLKNFAAKFLDCETFSVMVKRRYAWVKVDKALCKSNEKHYVELYAEISLNDPLCS